MNEASAVERLFRLFGEEKFKIGNIKGTARIRELASLLDVHSLDSIDTESSNTRGRSGWVHSKLLDSSVAAGEGGAVGNRRGAQPRYRTRLGDPELS